MKSRNLFFLLFFCILILHFSISVLSGQDKDVHNKESYFKSLKWRCIGPFRGGRSVAVSGVFGDPLTYYQGVTGGGVWKTVDAGLTWQNISDSYFKTGSVGAIAVAQSDPNVVFVGMGEHAVRGVMTHHGDGVYKSTDAGKTWKNMGLKLSQHISRIIIHPENSDMIWVGVQGALYGPSQERGIYKSTDGGVNWKKVLYVDDATGCSEISIDPRNPRILYATTWEHGRKPWQIKSGGPGSGVYKSVDYGETWKKINEGLPKDLGKLGVSCSSANPQKIYLIAEGDSEKEMGGLFSSEDGGSSWTKISSDHRLIQRSWYYTEVFADPVNEHVVYVLNALALRSIDGGKNWEILDGPHGDYHDLWINPDNPKNMIIGDDGGGAITFNHGKTWSPQNNIPTAQIYRLNADNKFPYNVYGGQQDNTSFKLASSLLGKSGIDHSGLSASAGGESAFLAFDPDHPRYVLGGSYLGTIEIFDSEARAGTNIMAAPIQYLAMEPKYMKYRFNWNAPIICSRHEKNTYYHAAQKVLKTTDNGNTWIEISPDLTKNEKEKQGKGGVPLTNEIVGAENYGTISYIAESKLEKDVIWTGSDDGLVHITKDGGNTWQNVTPPFLQECLVNAIEVSVLHPGTAYIATSRFKFNDHRPGIYKTVDYGKTWKSIHQGIPDHVFTRVVREDPARENLLYAGTEQGIYISWDGGMNWKPFHLNLPVCPITDLMVHQGNLIAATSGRSIWILDDLFVLHQYIDENNPQMKIITSPEITLRHGYSELNGNTASFSGMHPTRGINASTGMVIYYWIPDSLQNELVLEIRDDRQRLIRKFTSEKDSAFVEYDGGPGPEPVLQKSRGLHRFVWDLRHVTMPGVKNVYIEANYQGHKSKPGKYVLIMKSRRDSATAKVEVKPNPSYDIEEKDYILYDSIMSVMEHNLKEMHETIAVLHDKKDRLMELMKKIPESPDFAELKKNTVVVANKIKAWDEKMVQRKTKAYDDVENFENKFTANYLFLINHTDSEIPKVNQASQSRKKELDMIWNQLREEAREIIENDLPALNQQFWMKGVGAI